jgi:hypothetical protein
MFHDTGDPTRNDRVQVQASIDGSIWTDVGAAISRYDGSNMWKQHTVPFDSYVGQSSVRLGFLGIGAIGNDVHIDDAKLTYAPQVACTVHACACAAGPPEIQDLSAAADKVSYSWSAAAHATGYDVVRGDTAAFPVGPGGGEETCFDNLPGPTVVDAEIPAPEMGFWYLSRGRSTCGLGTYGTRSDGSPRGTTTCP